MAGRAKADAAPSEGSTQKRGRRPAATSEVPAVPPPTEKRSYLKQSDVPTASLDDALRLPQAIFDHYAIKPTAPFGVAKALNVDPKGSQLRLLSGAAIAFGLIEGGAQATAISVTDLARRISRPKTENEDIEAKREAVLKPRIFGEFLTHYDGNVFPRQDLALNVLESMGVPRDKADEVLDRISDSARSVGFIEELRGKYYVRLLSSETAVNVAPREEVETDASLIGNAEEPNANALPVEDAPPRLQTHSPA